MCSHFRAYAQIWLCIFNFLSSASLIAKIIIMIILGNVVIMLINCNMFRSGQYGENRMSLFLNSDVYCIFYKYSLYFTK